MSKESSRNFENYQKRYKKNSTLKKLSSQSFEESVAQLFSRGLVKVHWVVVLLKFFETVSDAQIRFFLKIKPV